MGARIVVSRKFLPWKAAAAYTRYVYRVGIGAERRRYTHTRTQDTQANALIYLRWDVTINMTFEKFSVGVFRERSRTRARATLPIKNRRPRRDEPGINEIVAAKPPVLVLRHTRPSLPRPPSSTRVPRSWGTAPPYRGRVDEIGALIKLLPGGKAGAHTYVRNFWPFESPWHHRYRFRILS